MGGGPANLTFGSLKRLELTDGWTFKRADDASDNAWLPVKSVPTDVYRELLANEKIVDPFKDLNELSVKWVGDHDWVYKTHFRVDQDAVSSGKTVDIVFQGLDTFATVFLNGTKILQSENMFLSHRVNINEYGKDENVLEIFFKSPRLRGQELAEEHQDEHRFIARQTEESRIPVRKAQYHWGWDWGPILVGTSGPWRPVYLEYHSARIDDLWAESNISDDFRSCSGRLHCTTGGSRAGDKLHVTLTYGNQCVFDKLCDVSTVEGSSHCDFEIQSPELWYPFRYGAQSRYEFKAVLSRDGEVLDTHTKLIGFRKVDLVQQPDAYGKCFFFRINGVDTFTGGSCWIPASNFLSELSRDKYYDWIQLLKDGNQDMIRVWGGGIYEDDAFYDACDELGILVWQDFCFACGSYPVYPSFLQSFETEARQNVRRLRSHPSLIIWAGSNEDYQVQERYKLDYDYEDKDPQSWLKSSFPARYYYEYLLPKIIKEEHTDAVYHPTSPWGDGKNSADPTVGDVHEWNIWHGTMEKYQFADKLGGRYVSEFGMEAYPHLETILSAVTKPGQQYPGSMTMDFHNKAIGHERRLISYIAENFQVRYDLASFIHLSQIVQAEAMAYTYKTWRRGWGVTSSAPGGQVERKCGGVLVWQLNDCWPTMSWAVVDYYLVKKPAYYSISRALKSVVVGISRTCHDWSKKYMDPMLELGQVDPTQDARTATHYEVWVVNSLTVSRHAQVELRFISIRTGKDVLERKKEDVLVNENTTTEILKESLAPLSDDLKNPKKPFDIDEYDPYIIHVKLSLDGETVSTDTAWPQPYKYFDFSDRGVSIKRSKENDTGIVITAEKPVKGLVFEETRGMRLSENNFDVIPGEPISMDVMGVSLDKLRYTWIGAEKASIELPLDF